eukprot:366450-Chlamydomonas_euryale.AAC.18
MSRQSHDTRSLISAAASTNETLTLAQIGHSTYLHLRTTSWLVCGDAREQDCVRSAVTSPLQLHPLDLRMNVQVASLTQSGWHMAQSPCHGSRCRPWARPGWTTPPPGWPDARAHKHAVHAQLHHERGVRRRRHATGGKVDNRQAAKVLSLADQLNRRANLLGVHIQLVVIHGLQLADRAHHGAAVAHSLNHVAGAGLALCADHRSALRHAAQRLAQVAASAHKRHLEVVLVGVVDLVSGGQDLQRMVHATEGQQTRLKHSWARYGGGPPPRRETRVRSTAGIVRQEDQQAANNETAEHAPAQTQAGLMVGLLRWW